MSRKTYAVTLLFLLLLLQARTQVVELTLNCAYSARP